MKPNLSLKRWLLLLFSVAAFLQSTVAAQDFTRTEDVIYGRKHGMALTMDVFQPEQPNGYGVVFMVSGGFFSAKEMINVGFLRPFIDRGYTVFAVMHGSQPRYVIPEAVQDIHRAVRFIRHHAERFKVNPDKLGISGGSAGGHLSLTMGTQGSEGVPEAKDPIDRESSAVQAVACFFPPTDFLNYGQQGVDAVGVGILANYKPAFGNRADTAQGRQEYGKEISPVNFISEEMPPTLIVHGDADRLVPYQQAEIFIEKAKAAGATAKLVRRQGKEHGWQDMDQDIELFVDWFDQHLRDIKPD